MPRIALLGLVLGTAALAAAPAAGEPPAMVHVPAGDFSMGADDGHFDEAPVHRVRLAAFRLDRLEVTNRRFAAAVVARQSFDAVEGPWFRTSTEGALALIRHLEARYHGPLSAMKPSKGGPDAGPAEETARDLARWRAAVAALRQATGTDASGGVEAVAASPAVQRAVAAEADLPVRYVTWRDASAFCAAEGKRLPTEAEWERAARGQDGRRFPFGTEFDASRCVLGPGFEGPAPVGSHAGCVSASGALDLAGNVWEWVSDWYGERFYASPESGQRPTGPRGLPDGKLPGPSATVDLLRSPLQGRESDTRKVVRGGGFGGPLPMARFDARASRRLAHNPNAWHPDVGFRCASDAP